MNKNAFRSRRNQRSGSSGKTVLVVDDNRQLLSLIESMLLREGHDVVIAETGDGALQTLRNSGILDLVITDVVMPGFSQGHDVAAAAKRRNPNLPAVMMSGYFDPSQISQKKKTFDRFCSKPFSVLEIAGVVKDLLYGCRNARAHQIPVAT